MKATGLVSRLQLPGHRPRFVKVLRNWLMDPLPRSSHLVLEQVSVAGDVIDVAYSARGQVLRHRLHFTRWDAQRPLSDVMQPWLATTLGLVLAPHMFVLADFEAVAVRTAPLSVGQIEFWSWYLQHGLGEYRFRGGLDPRRPVRVLAETGVEAKATEHEAPIRPALPRRAILLNGGGKDTAVAAALAERMGIAGDWLTVTPTDARRALVAASGRPSAFDVTLELDDRLVSDARYRRGHVPYFALFVTLGVVAALAGDYDAVIAGNERSADEGNVSFRGFQVNHQFSKSTAFELAFQRHVLDAAGAPVRAFSIVRPFSDVRLAQLFTRLDAYLPVCMSCNRHARSSRWCLACPKCAFVCLAYGAFLDDAPLERVFGERPHERAALRRHWVELVQGTVKPWECVGTQEECRLALRLFLDRRPGLRLEGAPTDGTLRRLVADVDEESLARLVLSAAPSAGTMSPPLYDQVLSAANSLAPLAIEQP